MLLVRYASAPRSVHVGLRQGDEITPLTATTISSLLQATPDEFADALSAAHGPSLPVRDVTLLPPVDGRMEVWAAGVTYRRSQEARREESRSASVYELVYEAARPELFFKAPAWRVVTDGEPIGIRCDSDVDVPEPELALVLNSSSQIVGYTVCNDVSSRSIEGENPLYLPQAKVYSGSCALSSGIRLASDVGDPNDLTIHARIVRGDKTVWDATTSTGQLHRRPADLAAALFQALDFPDGAVLSTGTGIVPELDVTLQPGDVVTISIDGVGSMRNRVVTGNGPFSPLSSSDARDRPGC